MTKVDRAEFCDSPHPYNDSPQGIRYNATISAPHMHAFCLVGSHFLCIIYYRNGLVILLNLVLRY